VIEFCPTVTRGVKTVTSQRPCRKGGYGSVATAAKHRYEEEVTRPLLALALSAAISAAACSSTGAVPRPFPVPAGRPSQPLSNSAPADKEVPEATVVDAYSLAGTALALRGAPYRNGGTDPSGFDCSGFTQYVFAKYGIALPRAVKDQFAAGRSVRLERIAPGDLMFFTTVAPGASHVGIALGGDEFVHAPSSTGVVRVEHLSSRYWSDRFVGARRIG
jgi:cell wall-associated NlpC family hydrolase